MKRLLLIVFLLPLEIVAQNRYVVNNMPGTTANFSSLQTAVDAVPSGSILYIMPSAIDYGLVTVNKTIKMYGPGYLLGENTTPNTQSSYGETIIKSIWFQKGSDNSVVEGIKFVGPYNNVFTSTVYFDTVTNVTVAHCFFYPSAYGAFAADVFSLKSTNCTISNNLFRHLFGNPKVIWGNDAVNLQVRNNIIESGEQGVDMGGGSFSSFRDITLTNNIIYTRLCTSLFTNLKLYNNILLNGYAGETNVFNQVFTGTNNIADFPNVFNAISGGDNRILTKEASDSMLLSTLPGYHSSEEKWRVRDTSFAKTWGQGGIECGAFGNSDPYKLSGIPKPLPFIYQLTIAPQASSGGTIQVHIKAKASN